VNYSPRLVNKLLPTAVSAPPTSTAASPPTFCWARHCRESQNTKYGVHGATTLRHLPVFRFSAPRRHFLPGKGCMAYRLRPAFIAAWHIV